MKDKSYWWNEAKKASAIVGWFPTVILAQWQHETGNFSSSNFINNNNIAGQTWREYMPEFMKGTARPKSEGGFYIKYDDAVDGYTDFILKNGRYARVKDEMTEEGQIHAIANAGWAVDTEYAKKVINTMNSNKKQGYICEVKSEMEKWVGKTIVHTWMKPAYEKAKQEGNTEDMKNIRILGNKIRLACGMKEDEEFE